MFVSIQVTANPKPPFTIFKIDPVTGELTPGQTVRVTGSGALFTIPFEVELLDEGDRQPMFSASAQFSSAQFSGSEPFSFVVPTTLRSAHRCVESWKFSYFSIVQAIL